MFILALHLVLIVHGLNSEVTPVERKLDKLLVELLTVGDPDTLSPEDHPSCKTFNTEEFKRLAEEYGSTAKGLSQKIVETLTPILIWFGDHLCGTLSSKLGHAHNTKHVEFRKVRLGFQSAMSEAIKKNTKATLSLVVCQFKLFLEKTLEIYSECPELEDIFSDMEAEAQKLEQVLEEKVKAAESCEFPEPDSNPSEYKSIYMPLFKALENLQSKN